MNYISEHNKTDRNRFTRMCIGEALASLLEHNELNAIKISDITARAGISRMTYYNYYHTKTDVLSDYLHEIVSEYVAETNTKKDIGKFHDYTHILHCLHFFDQYADFIRSLIHAGLYSIIIDAINNYMRTEILPQHTGSIYELYYYSGALLNLYTEWITSEKKESTEDLAAIICSFIH